MPELEEELDFHIAKAMERNVRQGLLASVALAPLLSRWLFGMRPWIQPLATAVATVVGVAVVATLVPGAPRSAD